MQSVLDDARIVLHRVESETQREVGLGKNEIHPLAYQLKQKTDGELFGDANFKSGYRGVRSPEIRKVLTFFKNDEDKKTVRKGEENIEHSDEYFYLSQEEDVKIANEEYERLGEDTKYTLSSTMEDLTSDPIEFIRETNEEFEKKVNEIDILF